MHSCAPFRRINPIYDRAFRTDRSVKFQRIAWTTWKPELTVCGANPMYVLFKDAAVRGTGAEAT